MREEDKIRKINPFSPQPEIIAEAARVIQGGGVVIIPTRCLYGIAADAFNKEAVNRVFRIKGRSFTKPLLILIKDRDVVKQLALHIPAAAETIMDRFWPGEITLVFQAKEIIPENLTAGTGKIGMRVPEHPVSRALVHALDMPVTGTSANISQDAGCSEISTLAPQIFENVDLVIDAGALKGGTGSTVIDVTSNPPAILREGGISAKDIFSVTSPHFNAVDNPCKISYKS